MRPILICVIQRLNNQGFPTVAGYRLLDIDTRKVMDADKESVIKNIENGMQILGFNNKGYVLNNNVPIELNGAVKNIENDTAIELMPNNVIRVANYKGKILERRLSNEIIIYDGIPKGDEYKVYEYRETLAKKSKIFRKFYDINENGVVRARDDYPTDKIPEELILPNGITSVGNNGFTFYSGIKKIVIPETCESIGIMAFAYMKDLEEVQILGKVTKIPPQCFFNCHKLKKVVLSSYVDTIEACAFENCYSLKKIHSYRSTKITNITYGAIPLGCVIERCKKSIK